METGHWPSGMSLRCGASEPRYLGSNPASCGLWKKYVRDLISGFVLVTSTLYALMSHGASHCPSRPKKKCLRRRNKLGVKKLAGKISNLDSSDSVMILVRSSKLMNTTFKRTGGNPLVLPGRVGFKSCHRRNLDFLS